LTDIESNPSSLKIRNPNSIASSHRWEKEGMDFTDQQAKEEGLMKELLTLFGIVGIFSSLCPQRMFLIAGDSQISKPPSE